MVLPHGSVAAGTYRHDSDIDLLVASRRASDWQKTVVEGMEVETVTRSIEEWASVLQRPLPA